MFLEVAVPLLILGLCTVACAVLFVVRRRRPSQIAAGEAAPTDSHQAPSSRNELYEWQRANGPVLDQWVASFELALHDLMPSDERSALATKLLASFDGDSEVAMRRAVEACPDAELRDDLDNMRRAGIASLRFTERQEWAQASSEVASYANHRDAAAARAAVIAPPAVVT